MSYTNKKRGFTLLETVIYVALLAILMTGALTASSDLIQSSGTSNSKATVQEEGGFVQRKLEWALYGATAAPTVGGSGCNQTLTVTKLGANNPLKFRFNTTGSSVEMSEGVPDAYYAITTPNVKVTCLKFATITAVAPGPSGIIATTTVNNLDFVVTKFVRQ